MTVEIERQVNHMMLKDLRVELRNRGLSPAGGLEALRERLIEAMVNGGSAPAPPAAAEDTSTGVANNNYHRAGGQNTGNFITDRPTSRVLAAPGGASQISFGDYKEPAAAPAKAVAKPAVHPDENTNANVTNNYSRPEGQNTGNFITDRPSSKVLAPPGGGS
eukprot:scaffold652485_cov81-Prasinocladus_malaysianus.AAC.1